MGDNMNLFNSLIDYISSGLSAALFDGGDIGRYGESLTEVELRKSAIFGMEGKILRNLYVPKDNGETTEIDVLFICSKGILVIESKNYSGWIFGNEDDEQWTATLPNGERNRFYNPIKQNQTHIKWLLNYMGMKTPRYRIYSVIAFSERCTLKSITTHSSNLYVENRDQLSVVIRDIWQHPDCMKENEILAIYNALMPLTNVDIETKKRHVESLKSHNPDVGSSAELSAGTQQPLTGMILKHFGLSMNMANAFDNNSTANTATSNASGIATGLASMELICPRCGSKLVLRTAGKGPNAGKQFCGCSRFPNCRYVKNLQ